MTNLDEGSGFGLMFIGPIWTIPANPSCLWARGGLHTGQVYTHETDTRSQSQHRTPVHQFCMSLVCERKREHQDRTHGDTGRTPHRKVPWPQIGWSPGPSYCCRRLSANQTRENAKGFEMFRFVRGNVKILI